MKKGAKLTKKNKSQSNKMNTSKKAKSKSQLELKQPASTSTRFSKERLKIDFFDMQILKSLENRFKVVRKIQKIKNKNNLPIEDLKREKAITDRLSKKFPKINSKFIKELYKLIFAESKTL